jgi:SAM-dependent methyltransferase
MTNFSKRLADDYDKAFFRMHVAWKREYETIAEILDRNLHFQSVVDFGCGNRYILSRLERLGKTVLGIDGSISVLEFEPAVRIADLTQRLEVGLFDLAICTEVAEHIDEKFADVVVDNVARAARRTIFFSAARKGKGGHLHVNEQEPSYWAAKFARHGFNVDGLTSETIRDELTQKTRRIWWFAANAFVMVKAC